MITLNTMAEFTWSFGNEFLLETADGNYVWSDPEYDGDNTIKRFNGDYKQWCAACCIPYGRDKGKHYVEDYCGSEVKFV